MGGHEFRIHNIKNFRYYTVNRNMFQNMYIVLVL